MKKLLIPLLCIVFLNLSISLAFADANDAKIIYLKGQVKLQRAGGVPWVVAKEGMVVRNGDKIKTFKFSAVEVAIDKDAKNVLRIEEDSELLLDEKRASLSKGKVFALLEALEPGSSFEVRTPTAVCGVAGSGIFVDTDGNKTTTGCHEDQSYAKGIKGDGSLTPPKIIKAGYKCIIGKFKLPGALIALSKAEKRTWSGFREDLREHLKWLKGEKRKGSGKLIDTLQDKTDKLRDGRLEKMEQKKREEAKPTKTGGGDY